MKDATTHKFTDMRNARRLLRTIESECSGKSAVGRVMMKISANPNYALAVIYGVATPMEALKAINAAANAVEMMGGVVEHVTFRQFHGEA